MNDFVFVYNVRNTAVNSLGYIVSNCW